ncbi:MAG TPA: hypothetical protein DIT89_12765, partial [Planctomycetaceae bacterium]|nr:hypothetical protein [Planctomycetaceae bacterium]
MVRHGHRVSAEVRAENTAEREGGQFSVISKSVVRRQDHPRWKLVVVPVVQSVRYERTAAWRVQLPW